MKYTQLAISDPSELIYGKCPLPVSTRHGMEIGGGLVFNAIHNIQALTPVDNVIAMIDAVHA